MYRLPLLLFILFSNLLAHADSPVWANKTMSEDSKYFYFVGRGSGKSLQEAQVEARRDATETAIRELFGYRTKIKTVTYEDSKSTGVVKGKVDSSRSIRLKDFNEGDFYKETDSSGINVYVRYKYSKSAIKDEFERLAYTEEAEESLDVISVQSAKNGKIEYEAVDTTPSPKVKDVNYSNYYNMIRSWAILGGIGYSSKTFDGGYSYRDYYFGLEKRIWNFAIRINYEMLDPEKPSVEDERSGNSLGQYSAYGLAIPYYFTTNNLNNYYISIEVGRANARMKSLSTNVEQNYYGGKMGLDMLLSSDFDFGADIQLGARRYSDFENLKGQTSFYFLFGARFGF